MPRASEGGNRAQNHCLSIGCRPEARLIFIQLRTSERGLLVGGTFGVFESSTTQRSYFRGSGCLGSANTGRFVHNQLTAQWSGRSPRIDRTPAVPGRCCGSPPVSRFPSFGLSSTDSPAPSVQIAGRGVRTGGWEAGRKTVVCPPRGPGGCPAASANREPGYHQDITRISPFSSSRASSSLRLAFTSTFPLFLYYNRNYY